MNYLIRCMHADIILRTTMIVGYAQDGFFKKTLNTLMKMQLLSVKPNFSTFINILSACISMRALEEGMDIHKRVVENCLHRMLWL